MLFRRELAVKISTGQKTQTRRIVKDGESYDDIMEAVYANGKIKWQVGRSYGVQIKRGGFSVNKFVLNEIRVQRACNISEQDAIAEGFTGRDDFFATWTAINGKGSLDAMTWALTIHPMFVVGQEVALMKCTYADMKYIELPAIGILEESLSGSDIFWLNIRNKRYSVHPDWLFPTGVYYLDKLK